MTDKSVKKASRGRSAAGVLVEDKENSRINYGETREEKAHSPKRPPRVPLNTKQKLSIGSYILDEENYAYYWFSDRDSRLADAEAAYWEYCEDENGNRISRKHKERTNYLMRIDIEYWLEDQELKKERRRAITTEQAKVGNGLFTDNPNGLALQKDGSFDPLA